MVKRVLILAVALNSITVDAAVATWKTTVKEVMIDSTLYGGCMAKIASGPASAGLASCNDDWVSMDCFGNFYSKADAANKLSTAQLAYVTGNKVRLRVRDTYTYNGSYCVVERMDSST